ncbi:MAG: hypothetical protein JWO62_2743 [Acidimicrobiaceae bacterium]|jgi:predicted lipoprotein with Yx(FWY)xxD motif|nr:hypothetical protein [Acidimicrobiaceae bacterium]
MELTTSMSRYGRLLAVRLLPVGALVGSVVGVASISAPASATARLTTATVVHTIKSAKYGTILVNAKGFALYTYAKDTKNHSNCTGGCVAAWPVLSVPAGVTPVGKGVSGLGVATRANGVRQVTYHSKPLYRFASDTKAGQVSGQGIGGFSVAKLATTGSTTTQTTTRSGYGYRGGY